MAPAFVAGAEKVKVEIKRPLYESIDDSAPKMHPASFLHIATMPNGAKISKAAAAVNAAAQEVCKATKGVEGFKYILKKRKLVMPKAPKKIPEVRGTRCNHPKCTQLS